MAGRDIADLPQWRRVAFCELYAWMTSTPTQRVALSSAARQINKTTLMLQSEDKLLRAAVPSANPVLRGP